MKYHDILEINIQYISRNKSFNRYNQNLINQYAYQIFQDQRLMCQKVEVLTMYFFSFLKIAVFALFNDKLNMVNITISKQVAVIKKFE